MQMYTSVVSQLLYKDEEKCCDTLMSFKKTFLFHILCDYDIVFISSLSS